MSNKVSGRSQDVASSMPVPAINVSTQNNTVPVHSPSSSLGVTAEQGVAESSHQYNSNGAAQAREEIHADANFAVSDARVSARTNVLNLQLAEGTQSLNMPPAGVVHEGGLSQAEGIHSAAAIQQAKAADELRNVPTLADLESLKSGELKPEDVAAALKQSLLSKNPQVASKAVQTLQAAESYTRKAEEDRKNYAGTGFTPFHFPKLQIALDSEETGTFMQRMVQMGNRKTVDVLLMASDRGLLKTTPDHTFHFHRGIMGLHTGESALLPGSDGHEAPRGAKTFQEEWKVQVEPGLQNIRDAIVETAKVRGAGCPYARGNHAKGIAFDRAEMKLDPQAPSWMRDLVGSSLQGGMIRVSGSQTNPDQPDQESHMPGIRVVFPVKGTLGGDATQLIDITANTGSSTHAQTAAEHTQFTKDISTPKSGLAGLRPVRAATHALGALLGPGKVMDRIRAMRNAVQVTDMAMGQRFHEHQFFGRHAFFVGGRYVQVRFEVVEPKNFPDPRDSNHPNARLNAVQDTVARQGMKLAMYMTELPEGNPNMVEQEGWKGLPEVKLATIAVPAQTVDNHGKASQWFEDVPHVPGGQDKVFHAAGLGRHRVPVYMQSGKVRNDHNNAP